MLTGLNRLSVAGTRCVISPGEIALRNGLFEERLTAVPGLVLRSDVHGSVSTGEIVVRPPVVEALSNERY